MSALLKPIDGSDLDIQFLTRELDRTKSGVFLGKNAAFFGPLMCSLNFFWTDDHPTACTDGVNLMWNPRWFLKLKPMARRTVLMHELWHPGSLHFVRMGERNPLIWNYACDIVINNRLHREGYSFEGIDWCWKDLTYSEGTAEEDVYDDLIKLGKKPTGSSWGPTLIPPPPDVPLQGDAVLTDDGLFPVTPSVTPPDDKADPPEPGDMLRRSMTKEDQARAINNVVQAVHQATIAGASDDIPGNVEKLLKQFLNPVVPWEKYLHQWFTDLMEGGYDWKRPNRRFSNIYLPGRFEDEGRLIHMIKYQDTSGSITDKDSLRFNSEFKYVWDTYQPKKLSLVQFDTIIQQEITFNEGDEINEILVKGRGGTNLTCVREHIIKHRPSVAVIFSDLDCAPMERLPVNIPVLWVCISNRRAKVNFGTLIHIR